MELAWKRQAEEEAALAALAALAGKNKNLNNNVDGGDAAGADADDQDGPLSFAAKRRLLLCPPGSVTRLRSVAHLVSIPLFLVLFLCSRERERGRE